MIDIIYLSELKMSLFTLNYTKLFVLLVYAVKYEQHKKTELIK